MNSWKSLMYGGDEFVDMPNNDYTAAHSPTDLLVLFPQETAIPSTPSTVTSQFLDNPLPSPSLIMSTDTSFTMPENIPNVVIHASQASADLYHFYQLKCNPVSSYSISDHVNVSTEVTENMTTTPQQPSICDQEISNTLTIPQYILKDPVKVLYLFQCFQEAQNDNLCDILSNKFGDGRIVICKRLLPHQVMSLGFFLSRSHRKWEELNLNECFIGDHGTNLLDHYLCGDKGKHQISKVNFGGNFLTDASSSLVGNLITYLQPHTVNLNSNSFTSVRDISIAVVNTNTVKALYMEGNGLTAKEASAISNMMTCLEKLNLSYNKLGDDGAVIVSEGIMKTNTLRVLDICNNNITSTGDTAIANSLLHNTSLEELSMSLNSLKQCEATAIAQAITNNKTLKILLLKDPMSVESAMIILNSLCHNNSITLLGLPREVKASVESKVEYINITRKKSCSEELKVEYT